MSAFLEIKPFVYFFHVLIGFVQRARVVEIALGIFVHNEVFKPAAGGIEQRAVFGNVLFLYHCYFGIQFSAFGSGMEVTYIHIVIHSLLFGSGNNICYENRKQIGL